MMRPTEPSKRKQGLQQLLLFIIFLLFGMIVTNHVTAVRADRLRNDSIYQYRKLEEQIKEQEERSERLQAENLDLNARRTAVIEALLIDQGQAGLLQELQLVRVLAGFTEVSGPGVQVVLSDKPDYDILIDSDASIVHDGDIRHVLDLLRNAGAAALSVNKIRITQVSSVICIGSTIRCNQERMLPPFVIEAIGDPKALKEVIEQDEMLNARKASEIGLVVMVNSQDQVTLPPFAQADQFQRYISLLEGDTP